MNKETRTGLTIGYRLALGFGVMIALTVLVGAASLVTSNLKNDAIQAAHQADTEMLLVDDLEIAILQARRHEKDFLLRYQEDGFAAASTTYVTAFDEQVKNAHDIVEQLKLAQNPESAIDQKHLENLAQLDQGLQAYDAGFKQIVELVRLRANGDSYAELLARDPEAAGVNTTYRDAIHAVEPLAEEIATDMIQTEEQAWADYAAVQNLAQILNYAFLVASVVIGSGLAFFIARGISSPLGEVTRVASDIAAGDLTQEVAIASRDELGQLATSFNHMTATLREMVNNETAAREAIEATVAKYLAFVEHVAQGDLTQRLGLDGDGRHEEDDPLHVLGINLNMMVDGLADMARQIQEVGGRLASATAEILASTTQQLSSITEQDASVNQTTTTVNEVRATVAQAAERAESVAGAAQQSVEVSGRGQQAVASSIEGMQLIRERVEGIATNILALSEKTQQIGEIIASVNDIAEQSKMLALNASIEASRAGEEGKGFAVVAMEVRNLAEQSREATEQVRLILNEIQQATNAAVMATEEGTKGVDAGQARVEQAGTVIEELAVVIQNAAQSAVQIAASSRQQTTGMDQLAMAMDTIRQASVQSQTSTQQAERAAQDLNAMAAQLERAIARYKLNGSKPG